MVDPDYGRPGEELSELHLDSAISHLMQATRSPSLPPVDMMDVYFHLAQAHLAKLYHITDRMAPGESLTKTLASTEGLIHMRTAEGYLREALSRVTPANTESTQDGYVYYWTSLKLSEFRMLESACRKDVTAAERDEILRDSVVYLVQALISRPIADNMDLHYIGERAKSDCASALAEA